MVLSGLFHLVGVENVVLTSSSFIFEQLGAAVGLPAVPSYVPGEPHGLLRERCSATYTGLDSFALANSMLDRLQNVFVSIASHNHYNAFILASQHAFDERRSTRGDGSADVVSLVPRLNVRQFASSQNSVGVGFFPHHNIASSPLLPLSIPGARLEDPCRTRKLERGTRFWSSKPCDDCECWRNSCDGILRQSDTGRIQRI